MKMGLNCKAYLIVRCRFNKSNIPKQETFEPTCEHKMVDMKAEFCPECGNIIRREHLEEICISCHKAIATQKCARCNKWFCISCVPISAGRGCEEHIRCMKCFKEEHPTKKTEAAIRKWEKKNATLPTTQRRNREIF